MISTPIKQPGTPNEKNATFKMMGTITLIDVALVILWLILLVTGIIINGPIESLDDALQAAADRDWMFTLTYSNAVMLTILTTWVFSGLYLYCKPLDRHMSMLGIILVPIYSLINLFAYLSQITVVPKLIRNFMPEANTTERVILGQLMQAWPESSAAVFNNFAYALLGLSSIFFGIVLLRIPGDGKKAGLFLIVNGGACIIGFIGLAAGNSVLGMLSAIGGLLFIVALIFLGRMFTGAARRDHK